MFIEPANQIALLGPIYLLSVAIPLGLIDLREHRLPNKLVLPAIPITLLGQFLAAFLFDRFENLVWALVFSSLAFAIALGINRAGVLGMGDVKLIASIFLALGWFSAWLPVAAVVGTLLSATLGAMVLLATKRISLGAAMPLGPYLLIGFASALTVGVWS
ncbi:MAG: prepilin peptidase [Actinomycetota bacterium]